ncbi:MAG: thioredoxin [Bacteroidales bacterium]|jgi:thioredoxin|nr:thioredoxin [Bacteroidales bacterium]MDD3160333.1 thioredoxin [Bacteroidales bacterium]
MKKLIFMVLLLAGGLVTYACAQKGNDSNNKKTVNKMKTIELTKADFYKKVANLEAKEWKYLGDKPAVIDFYATWCGPCKAVAPILEELAGEYEGKVIIYKVDVDKEPALAAAFGIQSIPTMLFIPVTGKPQMSKGAMPKAGLKQAIDSIIVKK